MASNNFYYLIYEGPPTFCVSCGREAKLVEKMKNDSSYSRKICGAPKCAAASPVHFEEALNQLRTSQVEEKKKE